MTFLLFAWFKSRFERAGFVPSAAARRSRQWRDHGNALLSRGDLHGAESSYRTAISMDPLDALAHVNLGFVLGQQRRHEDALAVLNTGLNLDPNSADCHYLLGGLHEELLDFASAAQDYRRALELRPDFALACRDACRVLFHLARMTEASDVLATGLALNPTFADLHFYQGNLHLAGKQLRLALASYRAALDLGADYSALHGFIGGILLQKNEIASALTHLQRAVELDPFNTEAQHDLGVIFHRLGQMEQAIEQQQIAISQRPELLQAHSCLLFALSFAIDSKPQEYFKAAQHYGERARIQAGSAFSSVLRLNSQTQRPLRIGWVSGDLRSHAVALFLEGVLGSLASEQLVLIAFSNNPFNDAVTERLRLKFAQWHDIANLSDLQTAQLIQECNVDILIDLSGHTAHNRLPVFAYRPAPVQVSWLGYFASTGLAEMDYLLSDPFSLPATWQKYFTERIWYLPHTRLCMTPPQPGVLHAVGQLPAATLGHITFGCFQSLAKINDKVLETWSKVMMGVPGSRLRMQIRHLEQTSVRDDLLARLLRAGIPLDRVSLHGGTQADGYFAAHNEVDLILDTFPYPGGTTTAEALWMGVPTVTLKGESLLARQGASMMLSAGLVEWIATNELDYVERAIRLASDIPALCRLREGLRQQVLSTPLFDCSLFASHLAEALRGMYQERADVSGERQGHG